MVLRDICCIERDVAEQGFVVWRCGDVGLLNSASRYDVVWILVLWRGMACGGECRVALTCHGVGLHKRHHRLKARGQAVSQPSAENPVAPGRARGRQHTAHRKGPHRQVKTKEEKPNKPGETMDKTTVNVTGCQICLLYTSPSPRDRG